MGIRRRVTALCEQCGAQYVKCRFNKHNQIYCTRKSCIIKRRQERQRRFYRNKYRNDQTFANAERERCKNTMRRRRETIRKNKDKKRSDTPEISINLDFFTTGLLSQWIDSKDPVEIEQAARQLEKRGQQLATAGVLTNESKIFNDS